MITTELKKDGDNASHHHLFTRTVIMDAIATRYTAVLFWSDEFFFSILWLQLGNATAWVVVVSEAVVRCWSSFTRTYPMLLISPPTSHHTGTSNDGRHSGCVNIQDRVISLVRIIIPSSGAWFMLRRHCVASNSQSKSRFPTTSLGPFWQLRTIQRNWTVELSRDRVPLPGHS